MMRENPRPFERYRHFKGGTYQILALAKDSESLADIVVYQALYGDCTVYTRTLAAFMSEVDRVKYPKAAQTYRFERIEQEAAPAQGAESPAQESAPVQGAESPAQEAAPVQGAENPAQEAAPVQGAESPAQEAAPVQEEPSAQEAQGLPDADVLRFLDAGTYDEKLYILAGLHGNVTGEALNTMAMSLDLELEQTRLEERYEELKSCLLTLSHYECERLH